MRRILFSTAPFIYGVYGAVFLVLAVASVWYYRTQTTLSGASLSASVKIGEARLYPNTTRTPGHLLTTDTSVVCQPTYFRSIKDVPETTKKEVYKKYGIPYPQKKNTYELDRFVPIELGGSNDLKNLWPQPAEPYPGYREKNRVENFLHAQVCTGQMTLAEAQTAIQKDWYAVYLSISR